MSTGIQLNSHFTLLDWFLLKRFKIVVGLDALTEYQLSRYNLWQQLRGKGMESNWIERLMMTSTKVPLKTNFSTQKDEPEKSTENSSQTN